MINLKGNIYTACSILSNFILYFILLRIVGVSAFADAFFYQQTFVNFLSLSPMLIWKALPNYIFFLNKNVDINKLALNCYLRQFLFAFILSIIVILLFSFLEIQPSLTRKILIYNIWLCIPLASNSFISVFINLKGNYHISFIIDSVQYTLTAILCIIMMRIEWGVIYSFQIGIVVSSLIYIYYAYKYRLFSYRKICANIELKDIVKSSIKLSLSEQLYGMRLIIFSSFLLYLNEGSNSIFSYAIKISSALLAVSNGPHVRKFVTDINILYATDYTKEKVQILVKQLQKPVIILYTLLFFFSLLFLIIGQSYIKDIIKMNLTNYYTFTITLVLLCLGNYVIIAETPFSKIMHSKKEYNKYMFINTLYIALLSGICYFLITNSIDNLLYYVLLGLIVPQIINCSLYKYYATRSKRL
ncbi:hypothetical protein [Dysgonomonas mossii]|uniref:hypothetical protein n=1 Tax=Dysgonomonas mossii TaxID=163665 RepID=UPI0039918A17